MFTAQVQAAINDRIAAENESEIRRLAARAASAAAERDTATDDDQIDADNKIEAARVAAINAEIARENEARAKGMDTTSPGKTNGLYIALLAAAAFYFLG